MIPSDSLSLPSLILLQQNQLDLIFSSPLFSNVGSSNQTIRPTPIIQPNHHPQHLTNQPQNLHNPLLHLPGHFTIVTDHEL